MNSEQALNLLRSNSNSSSSSGSHLQRTQTGSNEEQVEEEQEKIVNTVMSDEERQLALANLFSSLSNLANRQVTASSCSQHQTLDMPTTEISHINEHQKSVAQPANQIAALVQQHQQQQRLIEPAATFLGDPSSLYTQDFYMMHQQQQNQPQNQQQRINYCTICNKELCNKYFMKTHMLKMHGINLEMEQPDSSSNSGDDEHDEQQGNVDSSASEGGEEDGNLVENRLKQEATSELSTKEKSNQKKLLNSASGGCKKLSMNKVSDSTKSEKSSKKQQSGRQQVTTSVMNGFAGNSMGGVVCDICNKELCSKYFLKVHKQNTHGIMTDYQDVASHHHHQFMYNPFVAPLAAANPFMGASQAAAAAAAAAAVAATQIPSGGQQQQQPAQPQHFQPLALFSQSAASAPAHPPSPQPPTTGCAQAFQMKQCKQSGALKRLRLSEKTHIDTRGEVDSSSKSNDAGNKQFESIYRLIVAQQQQQQQQPPHPQINQLVDPAANPFGALMCFGAIGASAASPFGAPSMSPAMIVDSILRNQHLFNRNKATATSCSSTKTLDRNNNNSKGKMSASSKDSSASSSSNSRYFSHYTEACPMCDRRFKSIKWLKTHMMNDHKQEISAYMQMMMQYFYARKSQQMAAVATMAAIEQQQHQNFTHQQQAMKNHPNLIHPETQLQLQSHHPQHPQHQPQQPQATSLLQGNRCFSNNNNPGLFQRHTNLPDLMNEPQNVSGDQHQGNFFQHSGALLQPSQGARLQHQLPSTHELSSDQNFIIDARCRAQTESVASSNTEELLHSPGAVASPTTAASRLPAQLNFSSSSNNNNNNQLICNLTQNSFSLLHHQAQNKVNDDHQFILSHLNDVNRSKILERNSESGEESDDDEEDEEEEEDDDDAANSGESSGQQHPSSSSQIKTTSG